MNSYLGLKYVIGCLLVLKGPPEIPLHRQPLCKKMVAAGEEDGRDEQQRGQSSEFRVHSLHGHWECLLPKVPAQGEKGRKINKAALGHGGIE